MEGLGGVLGHLAACVDFRCCGESIEVDSQICQLEDAALTVYFCLLAVYGVFFVGGMVALRKGKGRFIDEYRSTLWASVYGMAAFVVYMIVTFTDGREEIWGRIMNSVLVTSISVVYMAVTVGYPAYKWYLKQKETAEKTSEKTSKKTLQHSLSLS